LGEGGLRIRKSVWKWLFVYLFKLNLFAPLSFLGQLTHSDKNYPHLSSNI